MKYILCIQGGEWFLIEDTVPAAFGCCGHYLCAYTNYQRATEKANIASRAVLFGSLK